MQLQEHFHLSTSPRVILFVANLFAILLMHSIKSLISKFSSGIYDVSAPHAIALRNNFMGQTFKQSYLGYLDTCHGG